MIRKSSGVRKQRPCSAIRRGQDGLKRSPTMFRSRSRPDAVFALANAPRRGSGETPRSTKRQYYHGLRILSACEHADRRQLAMLALISHTAGLQPTPLRKAERLPKRQRARKAPDDLEQLGDQNGEYLQCRASIAKLCLGGIIIGWCVTHMIYVRVPALRRSRSGRIGPVALVKSRRSCRNRRTVQDIRANAVRLDKTESEQFRT